MPVVVFPSLAAQAAQAARAGGFGFWGDLDVDFGGSFVQATYSARTLVAAARKLREQRPETAPLVDIGLNRVVVDLPLESLGGLAQQVGLPRDLLVALDEKPVVTLHPLVRGRVVAGQPLNQLFVRVSHGLKRPVAYDTGCSDLSLTLLDRQGQPVAPPDNVGCTDQSIELIIQPGESLTTPTWAWRSTAPPAGDYFLESRDGHRIPLKVWDR